MGDAAIALGLAALLAATAFFAAATVARKPAPSFLLAAWLAGVTEVVLLALVLSPLGAVDRTGYAIAQLLLLGAAASVWLRMGRPLPVVPPRPRAGDHPILVVLALVVGLSLAYELVLVLTVPPNNWDSLTYHLSRAASWYQHHRVGWIHDAPTERQNAFPANAELALLWSFVAIGSDRLAAVTQFVAQLAALVATYGIAVRLGFRRSSAVFASLLLATFALVALESTTTQNDLFVASLVAACAYFLLGATPRDGALAGFAFALAVGTKLTAVVALPALLLLGVVARPSRRTMVATVASAVAGFAALGAWLYAMNVDETGRLLGHGGGRVEHSPALTFVGWLASVLRILYRFFDFSGFRGTGPGLVVAATEFAVAAAVAALLVARGRGTRKDAFTAATVPLALPLLALGAALVVAAVLRVTHFPIDPSGTSETVFHWHVSTRDQEDFSYFGPLGVLLLAVAGAYLLPRFWRRRPRAAALAAGLPLFLVGVALAYRFNDFVGRFMLIPVVLVAALLAVLYERRPLAAGVAMLAVATLVLVQLNNELKPVSETPWSLSRGQTLDLQVWQRGIGGGVEALERAVPANACVGAALGGDDASFPLFGPHLQRRVSYVSVPATGGLGTAVPDAVILGPSESTLQPGAGWSVTSLAGYWQLAVRAGVARPFACGRRSIAGRQ